MPNNMSQRRAAQALMRANGGSVSIYFALLLLPLILISGLAIDLGTYESRRSRLQYAADAAVLAAMGPSVSPNAGRNERQDIALRTFLANLGEDDRAALRGVSFEYSARTSIPSATIRFETANQMAFGPLVGVSEVPIHSKAKAVNKPPTNVHIEFWIDNSASMGIGLDDAARQRLRELSRNDPTYGNNQQAASCIFACHVAPTVNGQTPYDRAIANGIRLRLPEVQSTIRRMVAEGLGSDPSSTVYSVARLAPSFQYSGFPSSDVRTVGANVEQVTMPNSSTSGSPLTRALRDGSAAVEAPTDANRKRLVVILTDGMEFTWAWRNNAPRPAYGSGRIDPTACDAMKSKNITVIVVELPYVAEGVDPQVDKFFDDTNLDSPEQISQALAQCASPGFFFSSPDPATIRTAIGKALVSTSGSSGPVLTE